MKNLYDQVIEHLSKTYINVRPSDEMREILRIYLTEEEAGLVLSIGHPPAGHTAGHIAKKAGLSEERAKELLSGMAERGFIGRMRLLGRELYTLLPILPGFFELTFMKPDTYPDKKEELKKLWTRYKKDQLVHEIGDYPTSLLRVVPIDAAVEGQTRVYHYEEVCRIIDRAGTIAIGDCACRTAAGSCENPIRVCMMFDQTGELVIDEGFAERGSAGQARKILEAADEAGLVHCAMNCKSHVQILCSCCGCCCTGLQATVRMNKQYAVAPSSVRARIEPAKCKGCGTCRDRCWADAIEEVGDLLRVMPDQCIGCGLCVRTCKQKAISLISRERRPPRPPGNPISLFLRMSRDRGKTAEMLGAIIKEIR